jgi:hypothetical protein
LSKNVASKDYYFQPVHLLLPRQATRIPVKHAQGRIVLTPGCNIIIETSVTGEGCRMPGKSAARGGKVFNFQLFSLVTGYLFHVT